MRIWPKRRLGLFQLNQLYIKEFKLDHTKPLTSELLKEQQQLKKEITAYEQHYKVKERQIG